MNKNKNQYSLIELQVKIRTVKHKYSKWAQLKNSNKFSKIWCNKKIRTSQNEYNIFGENAHQYFTMKFKNDYINNV